MLELIQITNDAAFARRCDALGGFRLFVDLERLGKAQRQAGRNTFISVHGVDDVSRIRDVLRQSRLMVRVNPLHDGTSAEVDEVLARGADLLMLPMFSTAKQMRDFSGIVGGRVPIVPLLETGAALESLDEWIATPGLAEVYVGLNDLHISLGQRFMFEPLADGLVDRVAAAVKRHGLPFGFGGIARVDEGQVTGRDVLAEHLRLGSSSVILSRSFRPQDDAIPFEEAVAALRGAERELAARDATTVEADRARIAALIRQVAAGLSAVR
jgi:hypothetical protein